MDPFAYVKDTTAAGLRQLIEGGTNPHILNKHDQSLLFFAVQNLWHGESICSILIKEHRLDPTLQDKRKQTALYYAARTANFACVEVLVDPGQGRKGCNPDHRDQWLQTPLFYAVTHKQCGMVNALVKARASVNIKDAAGQTPLFWAKSMHVVKALFEHEANFLLRDKKNLTLIDVAKERENDLPSVAASLRLYHHMQGIKDKLAWRVLPNWSYYVIQRSSPKDVSELCDLENQFIEDHRVMLASQKLSEEDLHNEVGVNSDPDIRTRIVQNIASLKYRDPLRKDFTLKAVVYPSRYFINRQSKVAKVAPEPEVVGYVYFKLKSGNSSSSSEKMKSSGDAEPAVSKVVVSHLKVAQQHQGNSCAKLLLSGVLKFVENLQTEGHAVMAAPARIRELQLSVIAANQKAIALYRRLGFTKSLEYQTKCQWHTMKREVVLDLHDIAEEWMDLIQSEATSSSKTAKAKKVRQGERSSNSFQYMPPSKKKRSSNSNAKVKAKRPRTA